MLRIYRDKKIEEGLINKHVSALSPLIESRVKFVLDIISTVGTVGVSSVLDYHKINIGTKTVTAFLKNYITIITPFTKQEQWQDLSDAKQIKIDIINNKKDILDFLKHLTKKRIEEILSSKPNILAQVEASIIKSFNITSYSEIVSYIFDYSMLGADQVSHYTSSDFLRTSGVKTCVYCNIRPIVANEILDIATNTKKDGTRDDIDHFLEKSNHPLLALSFFNLIPSCLNCNQRCKASNPFHYDYYLHPYQEGFEREDGEPTHNQVHFEFEFVKASSSVDNSDLVSISDLNVKIKWDQLISSTKLRKLKRQSPDPLKAGSVDLFELESSYQQDQSKSEVLKVIRSLDKNSLAYINSLSWFYTEVNETAINAYEKCLYTAFNKVNFIEANYSKLHLDIFRQLLKRRGIII